MVPGLRPRLDNVRAGRGRSLDEWRVADAPTDWYELDAIRAHRERSAAQVSARAGRAGRRRTARGVHHAAFICQDVEETIRFYQDFLGFPLVELVENRDYAGLESLLLRHRQPQPARVLRLPRARPSAVLRRPSAHCSTWRSRCRPEQFAAAKAKLDDAGVDYLGPDRGADDSLYFRDPNGLGIELYHETARRLRGHARCSLTSTRSVDACTARSPKRSRSPLLVTSLVVAVGRPRGVSEATVAVPAAVLVVAIGVVPLHAATQRLREIGPTVGFLAAILVFGHLCAEAGVFAFLGARGGDASGGRPRRLLALVVAIAAAVTAVLTLDATVVLLTPVVLRTARG